MVTGGVTAAFGFRYQYLITVELFLDLYESPSTDWCVGVDLHGQDSADILVYAHPGAAPERAVQVKASLPSSAASMGKPEAERLLAAIAAEHPAVLQRVVLTNRSLTPPAIELRDELRRRPQKSAAIREEIDARDESVREVTARLIDRIARLRRRGGMGAQLHHILLAVLLDMVHRCGSQTSAQMVDRSMVSAIIDEPAATLADAAGRRDWGLTYGAPALDAVERPEVFHFLSDVLGDEALRSGVPLTAVLAGPPGTGKSVAAGLWAAEQREHYALTIWLDAASSTQLAEQTPSLMRWLGGSAGADGADVSMSGTDAALVSEDVAPEELVPEDLAQSFQDALAALPIPWLLVLDGATDHTELGPWVPTSGYGHTVITTKRGDWPRDLAPQIFIEAMPDADATALIRHRLAGPGASWDDPVDPIAVDFARRLGRWPLAIDLGCAWVRGLGGDLERLPDFAARLDRFHITEEDGTGLGAYPSAVGILVRELWSALSVQAQGVLAMVTVSGGSAVPAGLIEDWGHAVTARSTLAVDAQSAVRELVGASLLTRRLRGDAHKVSHYDEIISAHEGIRFALNSAGLGVGGALTYVWLEVCAEALLDAFRLGRIADAEALAPPIGSFLEALLSSRLGDVADEGPSGERAQSSTDANADAHDIRRAFLGPATTVMHNLGSLELLTGRFERAALWLTSAVRMRDELSLGTNECIPAFAATQIQTLGQLIQAEARRRAFGRIRPLVERALEYARDPQVFEVAGLNPPVAAVLHNIAENSHLAAQDCADLRAQIEQSLAGRDIASGVPTALDARVQAFGEATARAWTLAEEEQWSRAVETLLTAVAPSVLDGALLNESVEAVLDVALLLICSMLRRSPSTLASSWRSAFRRLTEWCWSVEIVDERQRVKVSFLGPIADSDTDELGRAVERARDAVAGDQQLEAWVQLAELAMEWLRRPASGILSERDAFPPGMKVFRRVGISEEILLRPVLFEGRPGLVAHNPGLLVRTEDREVDHVLHTLVELGFPGGPDETGAIRIADGWYLRVGEGGRYELTDPWRRVIFVLEPANDSRWDAWDEALHKAEMVNIICRDPADADPAEVFATPEQGLVRVVSAEAERAGPEDTRREEGSASRRQGLLGGLWSQLRGAFAPGRSGSELE